MKIGDYLLKEELGIQAGGPGSGRKPWSQHSKEFKAVLKKHGIDSSFIAPASEKDFYSQGGSASPKSGGDVHIHGDGSWTHNSSKAWDGRRGTLPQNNGQGSGAADLDQYLTKLGSK